jgi:hypothetical protein
MQKHKALVTVLVCFALGLAMAASPLFLTNKPERLIEKSGAVDEVELLEVTRGTRTHYQLRLRVGDLLATNNSPEPEPLKKVSGPLRVGDQVRILWAPFLGKTKFYEIEKDGAFLVRAGETLGEERDRARLVQYFSVMFFGIGVFTLRNTRRGTSPARS